MSVANTFSPDSTMSGPIVHVLRGFAEMEKPPQIEKGGELYYYRNRKTGEARFTTKGGNASDSESVTIKVLPAEAVRVYASDVEISVPVVVAGRTEVVFKPKNTTSVPAGVVVEMPSNDSNIQVRFTHPEHVTEKRPTTVDAFVEKFGSIRGCQFMDDTVSVE